MHELVGVDTGGTFTDFILYKNGSFVSYKIPSTPEAPEKAIIHGLKQLNITLDNARIVHGTTVATNTLLEGTGAKTAFITNKGLRDILLIGRQAREQLYSLCPQKARSLIKQSDCFEIDTRVDAMGEQLTKAVPEELQALKAQLLDVGYEAVAICLLFSFLNSDDEKSLQESLESDFFVSRSSKVMAEQREYERAVATWLNSYLGPKTQGYLQKLQQQLASTIQVMQSDATTLPADYAGQQAVRLLLSGPAGGVMAASVISKACDEPKLLTLDMGGTSTDVSLIDKEAKYTSDAHIAEFPLAISLLDIHTIGAGGGSIARVDNAGGLHVGPQSAGAMPGPACYGHGGSEATITDANVVLGRLPTSRAWESGLSLSKMAAQQAIQSIADQLSCPLLEAAQGIVDVANAHMAQALRVVSIHKGHDPTQFSLFPFGGAAGLHMCAIARELGLQKILVPMNAGALSAQGMIYAPIGQMVSRSLCQPWNDDQSRHVKGIFDELQNDAELQLKHSGIHAQRIDRWLELRYQGQSSTIRIPWPQSMNITHEFESIHNQRYGFKLNQHPIELVTLRLWAYQDVPQVELQAIDEGTYCQPIDYCEVAGEAVDVPIYLRKDLSAGQLIQGPCIIMEQTGTFFVEFGWSGKVTKHGHIRLYLTTDCP